jgi:hypothetical protein
MPYRSSTRFSVGGASGFSATGFRCTDLTAHDHPTDLSSSTHQLRRWEVSGLSRGPRNS